MKSTTSEMYKLGKCAMQADMEGNTREGGKAERNARRIANRERESEKQLWAAYNLGQTHTLRHEGF